MARIRSVKPALRISRVVASWPMPARYAWVLLWGYLDDYGRGIDDVRLIVADCFPLDREVTERKMATWLALYAAAQPEKPAPLCRYVVEGQGYLHSVNWKEHQRVNRPAPSVIPPCPTHEAFSESFTDPFSESISERVTQHGVNDSLRARKEVVEVVGVGIGGGVGVPAGGADGTTLDLAEHATSDLIAEWIDHCGQRPPGRVVGQIAREVKTMLDEGIAYADVRSGLAAWHAKGNLHPATLASVVHETRTAPTRPRRSTTDDRVQSALDLAAELRAEESTTPAIEASA